MKDKILRGKDLFMAQLVELASTEIDYENARKSVKIHSLLDPKNNCYWVYFDEYLPDKPIFKVNDLGIIRVVSCELCLLANRDIQTFIDECMRDIQNAYIMEINGKFNE